MGRSDDAIPLGTLAEFSSSSLSAGFDTGDAKWTVRAFNISTLDVSEESSDPAPAASGLQLAKRQDISERQQTSQRCRYIVYGMIT